MGPISGFLSWAGKRGTVPGQWDAAAGGVAGRPGLVTMGGLGKGAGWGRFVAHRWWWHR